MLFPAGYLEYVFGGKLKENDLVLQVLMESCKYAYDETAEKLSLRAHLLKEESKTEAADEPAKRSIDKIKDDRRMQVQRSLDKILKYRRILFDYYAMSGIVMEGLLSEKMDDINKRLEGHKLTAFQYWEINNVRQMDFVLSVVERKIRNHTKDRLEYETEVYTDDLLKLKNNPDKFLYPLALFTLEWKYCLDFLYQISVKMVESNIKEIPDLNRKLCLFCSRPEIISSFLPVQIMIDSRLLTVRNRYIPEFISAQETDIPGSEVHRFQEGLVVLSQMIAGMKCFDGKTLRDWVKENTDSADWLSVMMEYSQKQTLVEKKEWSHKAVKNLKYLYDKFSLDYKNLDFRS